MTEKLYYKDSMLFDFEATVTECIKTDAGYGVALDKTAFFPEGGGQAGDTGTLNGIAVTDTREQNKTVYHITAFPIDKGTPVTGCVDKKSRFRKMQNHSGEHIVSGIIHSLYGYENVGFHLGDKDVTIDVGGVLDREQITDIEYRANEAVAKDLPITAEFPSGDKLKNINYRSKIELTEDIRIVTVPGYDVCACCAPHVKTTGSIGIIKLLDFIRYKGGVRIHMKCGFDALADYNDKYAGISAISVLLSVKQNEAADAVNKLNADITDIKQKLAATKKELYSIKAEAISPTDGNIIMFFEDTDTDYLRHAVNKAVNKCGGICAAFGGNNREGYKYVAASATVGMRIKAKEINAALNGRGGGSEEMIQGSVSATKKEIEEYFA